MRGSGRVFRKRGLFALFALGVGLYVVFAVLPRRRKRAAEQLRATAPVRPQPAARHAAEPPQPEEPAETLIEDPAEEPASAAAVPPTAADRPLVFVGARDAEVRSEPDSASSTSPGFEPPTDLPPVAAIAGGPLSSRRAPSAITRVLTTLTVLLAVALVALIPSAVGSHGSSYIDLTVAGAQVTHDNVIFAAGVGPAGTGQFDPFLTVSPGGSAATDVGYNSDAQGAGTSDDDVFYGGGRTHTLKVSAIPPTVVGGIEYREFSLDGNDQGSDDFMSIETIELYIDTEAGVKGYVDGAGCTPGTFSVNTGDAPAQIYCLDAGGNETILMRTQGLSSGSGQSDISVLIPSSIFPAECFYGAIGCNKWVTFWFEAGFSGPLAQGAGCTGTCDYDASAGFEEWRTRKLPVVNVAKTANTSLDRKYDWLVKKYVSLDDTCAAGFEDAQTAEAGLDVDLFNGQSETVCWKIEPDRGAAVDSNQQISGTITITNPTGDPDGNGPLQQEIPAINAVINSVSDIVNQGGPLPATVSCGVTFPYTLNPQQTLNCTYSKALTSSAAGTNTASAVVENGATDLTYSSPAVPFNPATGTVNTEDESASLDDDRKPAGFPQTFTDTDPNNTPITYTESLGCPATRTVSNTATLTELDTSTPHTDPAYVNITCHTLDVSKTANTSFNRTFDWTVKKYVSTDETCAGGFLDADDVASALAINLFNGQSDTVCWKIVSDRGEAQDSGFLVTGTITITNNAPIAATPVSVTDSLTGALAATVDCDSVAAGNQNTGLTVPAKVGGTAGTLTCSYSRSLPDSTTRTNTATATLAGADYTGTAQAVFDANTPTTETDDTASLDDSRSPGLPTAPVGLSGDDTRTYTEVLACGEDRNETNTATLTEDDSSTVRTDPAVVTIDCHGLTVEKNATPTYTRTFDWTVKKYVSTDETCAAGFVDGTLDITLDVGQSDVVCWKIVPDRDAGTESDFAVSGTITITNNAPIAATPVSVADVLTGALAATVDCDSVAAGNQNTGLTVPAKVGGTAGTLTCSYSRSLPDKTNRTNTATATLSGVDYTGTADVTFGDPTTVIDESASLDDDRKPAGFPQTFTNTDPDGTPITYTETLTCGDTRTESNTADLEELDTNVHRTDPAAVSLTCVPVGEGCTPGFWKTHARLWDGVGANEVTSTYKTDDIFDTVFGVVESRSGLSIARDLLYALSISTPNLDGPGPYDGNLAALDRHATAALLNADATGVDFAYTAAEVIAMYQDAVGAVAGPETISSALAKLQAENERGCPL